MLSGNRENRMMICFIYVLFLLWLGILLKECLNQPKPRVHIPPVEETIQTENSVDLIQQAIIEREEELKNAN